MSKPTFDDFPVGSRVSVTAQWPGLYPNTLVNAGPVTVIGHGRKHLRVRHEGWGREFPLPLVCAERIDR